MWNKVKAALKAAKNAVIKAFRWITGTSVKVVGHSLVGLSIVVAFIVSIRLVVIMAMANGVIYGGSALVDVGDAVAGDGPIQIGKTYEDYMYDHEDAAQSNDEVVKNLNTRLDKTNEEIEKRKDQISEINVELKKANDLLAELSVPAKKEEWVPVPEGLNHDVHDVGVVSYENGEVFIKKDQTEIKAPIEAPFFNQIREALAKKGIEAKDSDFRPAIGGTGYLDKGDAKHLDPWTFGHDESGREFVVTPWIQENPSSSMLQIMYGRMIIFQRYPSSDVIVQGRLQGRQIELSLPYNNGKESFLAGIAEGSWGREGEYTFVSDVPELDKFGREVPKQV